MVHPRATTCHQPIQECAANQCEAYLVSHGDHDVSAAHDPGVEVDFQDVADLVHHVWKQLERRGRPIELAATVD